jgi:hypothetical protein
MAPPASRAPRVVFRWFPRDVRRSTRTAGFPICQYRGVDAPLRHIQVGSRQNTRHVVDRLLILCPSPRSRPGPFSFSLPMRLLSLFPRRVYEWNFSSDTPFTSLHDGIYMVGPHEPQPLRRRGFPTCPAPLSPGPYPFGKAASTGPGHNCFSGSVSRNAPSKPRYPVTMALSIFVVSRHRVAFVYDGRYFKLMRRAQHRNNISARPMATPGQIPLLSFWPVSAT